MKNRRLKNILLSVLLIINSVVPVKADDESVVLKEQNSEESEVFFDEEQNNLPEEELVVTTESQEESPATEATYVEEQETKDNDVIATQDIVSESEGSESETSEEQKSEVSEKKENEVSEEQKSEISEKQENETEQQQETLSEQQSEEVDEVQDELLDKSGESEEVLQEENEAEIVEVELKETDDTTFLIVVRYKTDKKTAEHIKLSVDEIKQDDPRYEEYRSILEEQHENENKDALFNRFFDIKIVDTENDGLIYEPEEDTTVSITLLQNDVQKADNISVVHFKEESSEEMDIQVNENEVTFVTDSFSVYSISGYSLKKQISASDGNSYDIVLTYDDKAGIPEGSHLEVSEIPSESEEWNAYVSQILDDMSYASVNYARAFDISIIDAQGNKIEPLAPVKVNISLSDLSQEGELYHFSEDLKKIGTINNGQDIYLDGFSVYVIVEGPEPISISPVSVLSLSELEEKAQNGLYISNVSNYYMTSNGYSVNPTRTGILKTGVSSSLNIAEEKGAVKFYFEKVSDNKYKIYCLNASGQPIYIKQSSNSLSFANEVEASVFTASLYKNTAGVFQLESNGYYINMQGGNNGKGFAAYNVNEDTNNRLKFEYSFYENDLYDLDGKSYGLICPTSTTVGSAMLGSVKTIDSESGATGLSLVNLTIKSSPSSITERIYIVKDVQIDMWTFESIREDYYYLYTNVSGVRKYISVDSGNISLVDTPDEKCEIRVVPGTTSSTNGRIRLVVPGGALAYSSKGFTIANRNNNNEYLMLADNSMFTDDDFVTYSAVKASISDTEKVYNGQNVIIYTKRWNESKKAYETFVINHDGNLISAIESGDSIVWIGSQINTVVWNFTEYFYEGTTNPNYYYDFQNIYSSVYLAPSIDGSFLSDSPVGVNLPGRRYGDYYSTIISWDDPHYDYAGIKVDDYAISSAPLAQADTLYFAIIDLNTQENLTTVETVDHTAFGMKMVLYDFATAEEQNALLGTGTGSSANPTLGLLSTNYGSDNYPVATNTGLSLKNLFNNGTEVNNLFIKTTYEASGYYEFDSTENFASLDTNTNKFKVYQQLGTVDYVHGNTIKHGQFMPFNDLTPGEFSTVNPQNLYDIQGKELQETNPRKYEKLYGIPLSEADWYFGMEIEAEFMQTPSGKDAWGNDIIFEFTGDDDFWFYVDGELVLDIGGIHSASGGSVNYSTGSVTLGTRKTSLYEVFKTNYETRNPDATEQEVTEYLNSKFKKNENNEYIFKDYTLHNFRMFYMERGAGASNLRMRFNLANTTKRQLLLSKEISGTEKSDYVSSEFAFQVYYDIGDGNGCTNLFIPSGTSTAKYQNSTQDVKFLGATTIDNVLYNNVLMLKPGQTAVIKLPDNFVSYKIVECGVKQNIYDSVMINGETVAGTAPSGASNTKCYESSESTIFDRAKIVFNNHINPEGLRTLTVKKKLFDLAGNEITSSVDPTGFRFRIRIGEGYDYYRFGEYLVKNENGEYCVYNTTQGSFVTTGKTRYDLLTEAEKDAATFITSASGAVDKIKSGYSIEIRDLPVGTPFRIEEPESDVPVGYKFLKYERVDGSFITDPGEDTYNTGTIRDNNDPQLEIHNLKGYSLVATKQWSDKDYVKNRDDIYFAVYDENNLVPNSVRKLSYPNTRIEYFFDDLSTISNLSTYKVYEVELEGDSISVDQDGVVSGYTSITRIENNSATRITATLNDNTSNEYQYNVSYTRNQVSGTGNNIRSDVITNEREGAKLYAKTFTGDAVVNAKFVVKKNNTEIGTYTSGTDGFIAYLYAEEGSVYTIEETSTPRGYKSPIGKLEVEKTNGDIAISPQQGEESYYGYSVVNGEPVITINNKPFTLSFVKEDSLTHEKLEGAHFALYRQVTIGNTTRKDYVPVANFENLESDADGLILGLDENLKPGTYYLTETSQLHGYYPLNKDVLFTITDHGDVSIVSGIDYAGALATTEALTIEHKITIENVPNLLLVDLTIENNVEQNSSLDNNDVLFTLVSVYDEINGTSYNYTIIHADDSRTDGTMLTGDSITLEYGEKLVVSLPAGKKITIQKTVSNYDTVWMFEDEEIRTLDRIDINISEDTHILVTNSIQDVSPTGLDVNATRPIIIFTLGILMCALAKSKGSYVNENLK